MHVLSTRPFERATIQSQKTSGIGKGLVVGCFPILHETVLFICKHVLQI